MAAGSGYGAVPVPFSWKSVRDRLANEKEMEGPRSLKTKLHVDLDQKQRKKKNQVNPQVNRTQQDKPVGKLNREQTEEEAKTKAVFQQFTAECFRLWTQKLSDASENVIQDAIRLAFERRTIFSCDHITLVLLRHSLGKEAYMHCHELHESDDGDRSGCTLASKESIYDSFVQTNLSAWSVSTIFAYTNSYKDFVLHLEKEWAAQKTGGPIPLNFLFEHAMNGVCHHITAKNMRSFFENRRHGRTVHISTKKKYDCRNLRQYAQCISDDIRRTPANDRVLCVGREDELTKLRWQIFAQHKRVNVIQGPAGSGKTALVYGFAKFLLESPSDVLNSIDVWLIDMKITTYYRDLHGLLDELKDAKGKAWLIVENIEFPYDCVYIIPTTRDKKYKNPLYEILSLKTLSSEHTTTILRKMRHNLEEFHRVKISDETVQLAAKLAHKYMDNGDMVSPGRARWLLDLACCSAQVKAEVKPDVLQRLEAKAFQLQAELAQFKESDVKIAVSRITETEKALNAVKAELIPMQERFRSEHSLQAATRQMRDDFQIYQNMKKNALVEGDKKLLETSTMRLKELGQNMQMKATGLTGSVVTVEHVAAIVSAYKGIPAEGLSQNEHKQLCTLSERLKKRVIDQDEAINAITKTIIRSSMGFKRASAPIGSFLFLGPSGVGKTETAKALAHALFHDENAMIRFDMSEFYSDHTVSRLVGAPPGYVGYEEGGQLTNAVLKRPHAVVLFDEIEKAHPKFFDFLLQILDDARLTSGDGVLVDFSNTIIILTSNLGSHVFAKKFNAMASPDVKDKESLTCLTALERAELDACIQDTAKSGMRPEFLGRLEHKIYFSILGCQQVRKIGAIQLQNLAHLLENKEFELTWNDSVLDFVASAYEPRYGARMLRGHVDRNIGNILASEILLGNIPARSNIHLDFKNNTLIWAIKPLTTASSTTQPV